MFLRKVFLQNFKCFSNKDYSFNAINLVTGRNGIGKSTLILDSLLFALYGYSDKSLKDLVTKGKKECCVTVEIDDLVITRKYPTALTIFKAGKELTIANNAEKQKYLDNIFKDVEYFRKFRMLDVKQGINILESGKTTLLKTLTSFHQDFFNEKRKQLLDLKSAKETFNRDKLKLDPFYPSEKRLKVLWNSIVEFEKDLAKHENEYRNECAALSELKGKEYSKIRNIKDLDDRRRELSTMNICPSCRQQVPHEHKSHLCTELQDKILDIAGEKYDLALDIDAQTGHIKTVEQDVKKKRTRLDALNKKFYRLENRIKQKAFKYTNRDVAITKKAIETLDIFVNKYIMDFVKCLEPIINDIIKKIDFEIKFALDPKGNLDIKLLKGKDEYSYKELSTGQKLIMTVAFQLSLMLQKGEHGLVIADEGFSSLSSENLEYVFSLFTQLPFQLVSVVHRIDKIPSEVYVIDLEK